MFITQLSGGATFMFTPRMDGCTFGVSSQNGDGGARVAHANFAQLGVDWGATGPDRSAPPSSTLSTIGSATTR